MNLPINYQSTKFQVLQLSESNFTEVSIRHPKHDYDVIMTSFHNNWFQNCTFVEHSRSYQPAKFHWPRMSGSNFMRAGGKCPPQTYMLSKKPGPCRVKTMELLRCKWVAMATKLP